MKNKLLKISLIGNTNSGKSTFFNTVINKRVSIISKKKNTTIDLIIGVVNLKNTQFILYDTPGLLFLESKIVLKKNMKSNIWNGIESSDIIFYFLDSSKKTIQINKNFLNQLILNKKNILIIMNKIDLISKNELIQKMVNIHKVNNKLEIFPISSTKNIGVNDLITFTSKFSKKMDWIYKKNEITNKNDIFISNEITRESLLKFLNEEIPYSVKVINCKFKIIKNKDLILHQEIIINKPSYKKIIVGKNGLMIKKIREYSQKILSKYFSMKTHLYLNVKFIK